MESSKVSFLFEKIAFWIYLTVMLVLGQYGCRIRIHGLSKYFYLFIYLGLGTIALDPTFGSFTLLEPVSH
jgi:hypothetical protein